MDVNQIMARATGLQRELILQHSGRMGAVLAKPNVDREVANKHRPSHWVNLCRKADGTLVAGTAGNAYTIVGKIPIGFEFDYATFDEADAVYYGIVDFQIDKYKANCGKGTAAQDPGPLSGLNAVIERGMKWAPSGTLDKEVGATDLDVTLVVWSWKTTTDPFHGVQLIGKDHSNYCPNKGRMKPATRGFRVLPALGKSSIGVVNGLVAGLGKRADNLVNSLLGPGSDPSEIR